jgi:hypothetical protein
MPIPGSAEYERMVDFMRADLENDMAYSKIIKAARDRLQSEGRNFDEEFKQWKEKRNAKTP